MATMTQPDWQPAISVTKFHDRQFRVVKVKGKQILLIKRDDGFIAINNRCPHEGFPLAEGHLTEDCVLTCNWHNWKFDLVSGETILGGDQLRHYPVNVEADTIYLDVSDPPAATQQNRTLVNLSEAFFDNDYERIARELARFIKADGDPMTALAQAFGWAHDQFEFGMTHAQAVAFDWLRIRDGLPSDASADRLVPLVEIIGHLADDVINEHGIYPYSDDVADTFDPQALINAIEDQDEPTAVAQARKALVEHGPIVLKEPLNNAALRHYQAFGHSVIYAEKTFALLERLPADQAVGLILPLVRLLIAREREDLIPEFRAYAPALLTWDGAGTAVPEAGTLQRLGVKETMELISKGGGNTTALYNTIMHAIADAMLHYDGRTRHHIDKPVSNNVDWLDFSHAVTHLNAARKICADQPELWPKAFLQSACFIGRNTSFVDWDQDVSQWFVADPLAYLNDFIASLIDHGERTFIFSAHYVKLSLAIREEVMHAPNSSQAPILVAALNRMIGDPLKAKHARRAAHQAANFVELEG